MTPPPQEAAAIARPLFTDPITKAEKLFAAAERLLPSLEKGVPLDARLLRTTLEEIFGGSDSEGAWVWKDAYEASEAAAVLFLRKYAAAIRAKSADPARQLSMFSKLASLLPSQTRRSEESQSFQQFSTPLDLGFVAGHAAAITAGDVVLEPSPAPDSSPFTLRAVALRSRSTNSRRRAQRCSPGCFPPRTLLRSMPRPFTTASIPPSGRA